MSEKVNTSGNEHGVSVVIPCLNEEESIGHVVDAAKKGIASLNISGEVIVVDNGSTDRSWDIAERHGAKVIYEKERGYGAAIRYGFVNAQYSVLVMGDGDMTYDFSKIDDLVLPIINDEADFVVGNRMENIRPGSMPKLHQYLGNPVLSFMLRVMFRAHVVKDAHCGLRAIRKTSYDQLHCVTTGMEFASEMIVRAIHCKIRMTERDIIYHPRVGESKLDSFKDGWRHVRFMLLHSPSAALLVPGIIAWVLGTAIVVPLAFGPVIMGGRTIDVHCMIMGGLLNAVSIQFLTIGVLAKAFAHLAGLREDPFIAWLYRNFTFERFIFLTSPLILVGLTVLVAVVVQWVHSGFSALDKIRVMFLGMLCLVNGTQLAAGGYLFSIMALPRHVAPFTKHPDGHDSVGG